MERAWLCGLVVLLWARGDACTESQGPTYRGWPYPTEGPGATQHPPPYYRWATILSVAALCVTLSVCTLLCCCSIYLSRPRPPQPPPNVERFPMEDLNSPGESPAAVTFPPSGLPGDPQGHLGTPPPSPVVQFHRAYDENLEGESFDLVHRNVSQLVSSASMETEPPAEH